MSDPALTQPTHLRVEVLHRLMRIFMEHKTDVLPVVERGRIVGQLDRLAIMEALSEIRPEGYHLTIKPPESSEEYLRRLDAQGLTGLATVTQDFEFNAIWGRAEILQAQGKIPQVRIWTPPASQGAAEQTLAAPEKDKSLKPLFPQKTVAKEDLETETATTITIEREPVPQAETRPPAPALPRLETRPVAENLHREIERGRLAINTLAALDLPLMACDGAGNEIFHNRAYADIRLRDAIHLKSDELVVRAKDAITESAMNGELDIDKAIRLKSGPRGYSIYCKAIRDFENPAARAVGYIFWAVATSPPGGGATPLGVSASEATDYAGKTLPDILAAEETKAMAWAMREANNNQSDAALLLGIPRQTFNYRYRRLMKARPARP